MPRRSLTVLVATVSALLVVASPALASLSDEVSAGQAVAAQLQRGKADCASLTDAQFEHLGEYVMDRMVGTRAAHEAMNERMTQAIGAENTDRMHELMGRRFAGCATGGASTNGAGVPMGRSTMGGSGSGGWGMMNSQGWGWMHDGSWQQMSPGDWRDLASSMMGTRYASSSHHGWSPAGVVGVALGGLVVGALLAVLAVRRPWQRRTPPTPRAT